VERFNTRSSGMGQPMLWRHVAWWQSAESGEGITRRRGWRDIPRPLRGFAPEPDGIAARALRMGSQGRNGGRNAIFLSPAALCRRMSPVPREPQKKQAKDFRNRMIHFARLTIIRKIFEITKEIRHLRNRYRPCPVGVHHRPPPVTQWLTTNSALQLSTGLCPTCSA